MYTLGITVTGGRHLLQGRPCQDCSAVHSGPQWSLAAVADGHGGNQYLRSEIGAQLAVQSALACIAPLMEKPVLLKRRLRATPGETLKKIAASIVTKWNQLVLNYDRALPGYTPAEQAAIEALGLAEELGKRPRVSLYGTTLTAAVFGPGFCFALQNGDGATAAFSASGRADFFLRPGKTAAERMQGGCTTSLSDADALDGFFYRAISRPARLPAALLCSTDGLFATFARPGEFLRFGRRAASMAGLPGAEKQLREHLTLRAQGGDDLSLALLVRDDADPVLLRQAVARDDFRAEGLL